MTSRLRAFADHLIPRSLRIRLVAIVVFGIVAATLVFGALMLVTVRALLIQRIDDQLLATRPVAREALTALTSQTADREFQPPSQYVVTVYEQSTGRSTPVVSRVGPEGLPEVPPIGYDEALERQEEPFTVEAAEGDLPWRVVTYPLSNQSTGQRIGSVSVALPLDANEAAFRLAGRTTLIGFAVAGVAALLGTWAVNRSFRPLREMESTAAAIAGGDFSRRMPEHPSQDTEVGRLTHALNTMLAQMESALNSRAASRDRMRRFVADASHELRTPLAAIRGYAELHRQGAVPEAEVPATFGRIEQEATRLGSLVEDLLTLARLDETRPLARERVDLTELAADAAAAVHALDPSRSVRLSGPDGGAPQQAVVVGDGDRLRQVLANLCGNAVRHTPPGSPVELRVVPPNGGLAVVEVVDHGPGIPDADKRRVFDRFARLDSSRARNRGGGAGLGLSIVSSVVHAHGGKVVVLDTPAGGATFRVELPVETDADPAPGGGVVTGEIVDPGDGPAGRPPDTAGPGSPVTPPPPPPPSHEQLAPGQVGVQG